jgi:hypothetical protein
LPKPIRPDSTGSFEQLMMRVAETLPAYRNGQWSPLEKQVFHGLLANAIQRRGSDAVTSEVLESIRGDVADVINQFRQWQRE